MSRSLWLAFIALTVGTPHCKPSEQERREQARNKARAERMRRERKPPLSPDTQPTAPPKLATKASPGSNPASMSAGQPMAKAKTPNTANTTFSPTGQATWLFGFEVKGKCGFIDRTGKVKIRPARKIPGCFYSSFRSDRLMMVRNGAKVAFMDGRGRLVIPFNRIGFRPFREGLAAVKHPSKARFGYMDRRGKNAIPYHWKCAHSYSEGLAAVCGDKGQGYLDRTGRLVIPAKYTSTTPFVDGLAVVGTTGGKSVIDKSGRLVVNGQDLAPTKLLGLPYANGLAIVLRSPGMQCGYVDKRGKVAIPTKFSPLSCNQFSEGLAAARPGTGFVRRRPRPTRGRVGYLDKRGAWVIPPKFDEGRQFSGGLAPVRVGKRWGFINKKGTYVIKPVYTNAHKFRHGLARVSLKSEWRYIDAKGQTVWSPTGIKIDGKAVPFTTVGKGGIAAQPKGQHLVIRDQATLDSHWHDAHASRGRNRPAAPKIDFRKYMLLAAFQGSRPSTNYGIKITRVVEAPNIIGVFVTEWSPSGCAVGMMMTGPWHIVKVPRSTKHVKFITNYLDGCGRGMR